MTVPPKVPKLDQGEAVSSASGVASSADPSAYIKGVFEQYWRYATQFRNWVIAYGAGLIYLIIKAEGVFGNESLSGQRRDLLKICWIAMALQVLLAFINKLTNYSSYVVAHAKRDGKRAIWYYRFGDFINGLFGVDFWVDLATMCLLAWASYEVFNGL